MLSQGRIVRDEAQGQLERRVPDREVEQQARARTVEADGGRQLAVAPSSLPEAETSGDYAGRSRAHARRDEAGGYFFAGFDLMSFGEDAWTPTASVLRPLIQPVDSSSTVTSTSTADRAGASTNDFSDFSSSVMVAR
jgi:hypothetical protein